MATLTLYSLFAFLGVLLNIASISHTLTVYFILVMAMASLLLLLLILLFLLLYLCIICVMVLDYLALHIPVPAYNQF